MDRNFANLRSVNKLKGGAIPPIFKETTMPMYQCMVKSCWRKMPDGRTSKLYRKGDYEKFKNDQEAGNHFLNIGSPKEEQAGKRAVLLEELVAELKVLTKKKIKTPQGTMPVSPDASTRKRIEELKAQITRLKPKKGKRKG